MLLACSGDATSVAVEAMQYLLQEGAVPDTWAPNGSSVSHSTPPKLFAEVLGTLVSYRQCSVLTTHAPAGTHACCFC